MFELSTQAAAKPVPLVNPKQVSVVLSTAAALATQAKKHDVADWNLRLDRKPSFESLHIHQGLENVLGTFQVEPIGLLKLNQESAVTPSRESWGPTDVVTLRLPPVSELAIKASGDSPPQVAHQSDNLQDSDETSLYSAHSDVSSNDWNSVAGEDI